MSNAKEKLWSPEHHVTELDVWKKMPPPIRMGYLRVPDELDLAPPPSEGYFAYALSIGCRFTRPRRSNSSQVIYGKTDPATGQRVRLIDMYVELDDITDEQAKLLREFVR